MIKTAYKLPIIVMVTGLTTVIIGIITSLSTLFSLYGKTASESTCLGDVCDISSDVAMAGVSKYMVYIGMMLALGGVIGIVIVALRQKK